jgi:ArsR family transcriptional regulator
MRIGAYEHAMVYGLSLENLLAVLSEPTRLAALDAIWHGQEACPCELMGVLGASQSRMSRHLARLKSVGLLTDRRDAQRVRYRRNPELRPAWAAIVHAVLAARSEETRILSRQKVA